jgi:membrane associated rhomboid family serine protease
MPIGVSAPPSRTRPWVTVGLVALAVAVFLRLLLLRDTPFPLFCSDLSESAEAVRRAAGTAPGFLCRYGAIPDELHEGRHLATLLTALFVHAGWFHLVTNMCFLAAFAPRVEEDLGHAGLLALFLGTGVGATAAHVLLVPDLVVPAVGASGAVAGVLGAHLVLAPRAVLRVLVGPVPVRLPSWFVIGLWAALQIAYTVVVLRQAEYPGGATYDVHVAGLLLGSASVGLAVLLLPGLRGWPPLRTVDRAPRELAPAGPRLPLYCRLLHLRHVRPSTWQRALLAEGALAAAVLLALADLASAWALLVLPVAVAAVVKVHDVLAGQLLDARDRR